jgi:hypothetical protein
MQLQLQLQLQFTPAKAIHISERRGQVSNSIIFGKTYLITIGQTLSKKMHLDQPFQMVGLLSFV